MGSLPDTASGPNTNGHGLNAHTVSRPDGSLDLTVLGMNSGTAMDGIDCALVRYRQASPSAPLHMQLLKYDEIPVPQEMKQPILHMLRSTSTTPSALAQLNVQLGHMFSTAVHTFCTTHSIPPSTIDLIGSHGQTIWLLSMPAPGTSETRSALCLGEGTIIAAETGITTVTSFRQAEQAVGRQGAPLVALIDGLLLHHPTKTRLCQNIGGIANLCLIPADSAGGVHAMVDWDCGPGNMFIDAAMRHYTAGEQEYDRDGMWAKRGTVHQATVDQFLATNPYINHAPPKTTGREVFGDNECHELIEACEKAGCDKYDVVATLTRITAENILYQYRTFLPRYGYGCGGGVTDSKVTQVDEIFMCGGGARNPAIVDYLRKQLPGVRICALDETGVPGDAKEAVSFAQQAVEAVLGRPGLVPVNSDSLALNGIGGKIAPGKRWREVMGMGVDFGRGWKGEGGLLPSVTEMVVDGGEYLWD
ncbi:Anhydro-N-acetylmuramic acid kinase [Dichotomopilus funicola]|uniref:Anhydro-N-acetylmuramic acid kinase n=1 Tax=Dichotomopilus funicola TaxID=1934379 RepID=A0AAN6UZ15_9PEZI|nr:Anhydro-N-acetylmuramic acid kinase [Dichotomopilus funicola]